MGKIPSNTISEYNNHGSCEKYDVHIKASQQSLSQVTQK